MKTLKKFSRNKKANTNFNIMHFILFRLPFLLFVTLFIYTMVKMQITTTVDSSDLELELFAQRIVYQKDGISFFDAELDRSYPGVIDISKFDQKVFDENISKTIYYGATNWLAGAKLSLYETDGKTLIKLKDDKGNVLGDAIVYFNKPFYEEKKVLYDAGPGFKIGKGGIHGKEFLIPIMIKNNGIDTPAKLKIIVLMQNV